MSQKTTQLSIIIPVYNGEDYLTSIIENILNLNGNADYAFEIILVNDGSSDGSSVLCSEIANRYDNIIYCEKENGGIASARNSGLQLAHGKYITFADQDDSVINSYDSFLKKCNEGDLDMLITAPFNRKEGADTTSIRIFKDEIVTDHKQIIKIAGKLIDSKYLSDDTVQFLSTSVWNVLYKKCLLEQNNIFFKSFIDFEDDWIFNIEALMVSKKIEISSDGYYCWNIHHSSESHREKYISDLQYKRQQWMSWLSAILELMEIEKIQIDNFVKKVLTPRNIMMCFNNACWKPDADKLEILEEIKNACMTWDIDTIHLKDVDEMDWKNKVLLFMLKNNLFNLAYWVNNRVLKKRFH